MLLSLPLLFQQETEHGGFVNNANLKLTDSHFRNLSSRHTLLFFSVKFLQRWLPSGSEHAAQMKPSDPNLCGPISRMPCPARQGGSLCAPAAEKKQRLQTARSCSPASAELNVKEVVP